MSKTSALASTLPIIFLLCCSQLTISLSQGTDVDVPTLLKIKEQFGNPDALSAWQPGTDHCQWPYVHCNFINSNRRVFMLDLENLNVTSQIPQAIADLSELTEVTLGGIPGLYGPIPSSLAKLPSLQQLSITGTSVSGPVPDFLCRITGLTVLVLYNNRLTGRIPECLAELQRVNYINLASNGLAGSIPRNLSAVPYWLVLSDNKLSGDASYLLGGGKNTVLNLAGNKLRFDLTNVQIGCSMRLLSLSHNDIYGQVPVSLQKSNVVNLDLSYNKLCGQIPTGGQMSQFGAQAYEHNKCLCGTPLPPCGSGR